MDMLNHRNNSFYEDMFLFDSSGKVVGVQTHSSITQEVVYNKSLEMQLKRIRRNLLLVYIIILKVSLRAVMIYLQMAAEKIKLA